MYYVCPAKKKIHCIGTMKAQVSYNEFFCFAYSFYNKNLMDLQADLVFTAPKCSGLQFFLQSIQTVFAGCPLNSHGSKGHLGGW